MRRTLHDSQHCCQATTNWDAVAVSPPPMVSWSPIAPVAGTEPNGQCGTTHTNAGNGISPAGLLWRDARSFSGIQGRAGRQPASESTFSSSDISWERGAWTALLQRQSSTITRTALDSHSAAGALCSGPSEPRAAHLSANTAHPRGSPGACPASTTRVASTATSVRRTSRGCRRPACGAQSVRPEHARLCPCSPIRCSAP